jgi:hypothetical protein
MSLTSEFKAEGGCGCEAVFALNAIKVVVWSHYSGAGTVTRFVRVGTLDNPGLLPTDVRIS